MFTITNEKEVQPVGCDSDDGGPAVHHRANC